MEHGHYEKYLTDMAHSNTIFATVVIKVMAPDKHVGLEIVYKEQKNKSGGFKGVRNIDREYVINCWPGLSWRADQRMKFRHLSWGV